MESWSGTVGATLKNGVATGFTVKEKESLSISVSGQIKHGAAPQYLWYGPANEDFGVKINGTDYKVFDGDGPVNKAWIAPASGELVFYVKDSPNSYGDNSGAFKVEVKRNKSQSGQGTGGQGTGDHGGGTPDKDQYKAHLELPKNVKFDVTVLVLSGAEQTVDITVGGKVLATFKGTGISKNLGTKTLESGDGQVYVTVRAGGRESKVVEHAVVLGPNGHVRVVGAEDGTDNDYNDSLVYINWPVN